MNHHLLEPGLFDYHKLLSWVAMKVSDDSSTLRSIATNKLGLDALRMKSMSTGITDCSIFLLNGIKANGTGTIISILLCFCHDSGKGYPNQMTPMVATLVLSSALRKSCKLDFIEWKRMELRKRFTLVNLLCFCEGSVSTSGPALFHDLLLAGSSESFNLMTQWIILI